jgi:hypothetical protein
MSRNAISVRREHTQINNSKSDSEERLSKEEVESLINLIDKNRNVDNRPSVNDVSETLGIPAGAVRALLSSVREQKNISPSPPRQSIDINNITVFVLCLTLSFTGLSRNGLDFGIYVILGLGLLGGIKIGLAFGDVDFRSYGAILGGGFFGCLAGSIATDKLLFFVLSSMVFGMLGSLVTVTAGCVIGATLGAVINSCRR